MARRNPKNKLEHWEVALAKAMIARDTLNDQEILTIENDFFGKRFGR